MLRYLAIRNLAVIDHLEVEFAPGLTVVTGETGAGKSMLVQAIDLLAGGRASADLIRTGEDLATVQAIFARANDEVIVRREISAQGRHRAFIDDALATSTAIRDLGASLVDLHGQHEHQSLLNPAEHVTLLDAHAGHDDLLTRVATAHEQWRLAAQALHAIRMNAREKAARLEWLAFQLQELDRIAPVAGEDDRLAAERHVLANADRLTRLATEAFGALYDGEQAALSSLAIVWKRLADLAALDDRFLPHLEQRDEVRSRLDDLAMTLRDYLADLDVSPERLQVVEDRLAALERLKQKYGPTLDEVIARQQGLRDEQATLEGGEGSAEQLEAAEKSAADRFRTSAGSLSKSRKAASDVLGQAVEKALGHLAMPHAKVEVRLTASPDDHSKWGAGGFDAVEFYLSPNPGEELRPLARIASGGELSRVMLALKTLTGVEAPGRTLVFDEVDAGIGGEAADAVGDRLRQLARHAQVLCITHLPQIAARGDHHLHISKTVAGGRTRTQVEMLVGRARELELARMMAGQQVTEQVVISARELLQGASERTAKGESESPGQAKAKGRRGTQVSR
jgi:DNA repair protein RecN (Recombination protein N)